MKVTRYCNDPPGSRSQSTRVRAVTVGCIVHKMELFVRAFRKQRPHFSHIQVVQSDLLVHDVSHMITLWLLATVCPSV